MPRVLAIAEEYFGRRIIAIRITASPCTFMAFQQSVPLNMSELWLLPPALKLVLLEEIAARGASRTSVPSEHPEEQKMMCSSPACAR